MKQTITMIVGLLLLASSGNAFGPDPQKYAYEAYNAVPQKLIVSDVELRAFSNFELPGEITAAAKHDSFVRSVLRYFVPNQSLVITGKLTNLVLKGLEQKVRARIREHIEGDVLEYVANHPDALGSHGEDFVALGVARGLQKPYIKIRYLDAAGSLLGTGTAVIPEDHIQGELFRTLDFKLSPPNYRAVKKVEFIFATQFDSVQFDEKKATKVEVKQYIKN